MFLTTHRLRFLIIITWLHSCWIILWFNSWHQSEDNRVLITHSIYQSMIRKVAVNLPYVTNAMTCAKQGNSTQGSVVCRSTDNWPCDKWFTQLVGAEESLRQWLLWWNLYYSWLRRFINHFLLRYSSQFATSAQTFASVSFSLLNSEFI